MTTIEVKERLRREQNILDRLDNVRRLIEMETTITTVEGARVYCRYCMTDKNGQRIGSSIDDLLHDLRNTIQLQMLSITALCYGDNPDIGEPAPMLEWATDIGCNAEDKFREVWGGCLRWNS